ncbi:Fusaric acid resistance protein conserved region (plasmid) [Neorhizobium galegae bv. officinalis bv. officinalis str. HAMBI 1141]|uniref:Fusaric acid resistance protein conserved region n=1 Tax=Neorhizobium galegae bv. officinalis bv. officinalis str. HAMBI 1141 TaxID=1028801 RepID=A0A068TIX3_NEOGA|nr:FUSC family protein [Neorhizobium galegae]CDN57440.1 Fusaric acid resistance protein conserved region [Neorhizobium galegae bv. officinalis bv. officinalis str. HAMBI 1141]
MSVRPVVTTGNVIFSLKTFLAAMLAYLVAIRFDLPRPFWAISTVYIVAHPLSGAISSKSFYRLLGTLIGGAATIVMVPNLVNEPVLLSAVIIAWVSACTFISLLDRTPRSYVSLLAGYTVLLAGLPLVTIPASTFDTVVSRIEEIGLAIICASIVSHVVFPVHVGTVLVSRIDGWMARARMLIAATATGETDEKQSRTERQELAADAADLRSFTVHLQYDGSRYRRAVSLLRSLQHRMVSFLPLLGELEDLRRSLARLDTSGAERALSLIAETGSRSTNSSEAFKAEIEALAPSGAPYSWEKLLLANAARNLLDILRFSEECRTIRQAMEEDNAARATRRFAAPDRTPAQHRDVGMALLSALAVAICLATSIIFWIASGWSDGMTFAQISGVLCCLLATMDDPVPAMRRFVVITIASVIAAYVYGYAILPMIDGFAPLVAALGVFLIPAGICLALPSLAIAGMGLCINFPLLLTLQAQQHSEFVTFSSAGIATILAMVWTIVVCGIFRSVRAETNAQRLSSVIRKHVAKIAAGRHADVNATRHRISDVAGLFASRAAKLPSTSDTANVDPMRDLRTGLHMTAIQQLSDEASEPVRRKAEAVFKAVEGLYDVKSDRRYEPLENVLMILDDLVLSAPGAITAAAEREILVHVAALRLCLAPHADPPDLRTPPTRRMTA